MEKRAKGSKVKEFLDLFPPGAEVVVLTHDNPDPDGLACQLALSRLLSTKRRIKPVLGYGGIVRRAENMKMIEVCDIELVGADQIEWKDWTLSILVDTRPGTGNNSFPADRQATAVIDHHPGRWRKRLPLFRDVRTGVGATSTIASEYLEAEKVEADAKLATALVYAIETETYRPNVVITAADVRQFLRLYPDADPSRLEKIRNARLPQSYFESFLLALRDSFTYGDVIFSLLPEIEQPDICAEIADFLVRFERVTWAFVGGVYKGIMLVSARTATIEDAGKLLRKAVGKMGTAGGHETAAGAQIALQNNSQTELEGVFNRLRERILRALGIQQERGARLVARRDILAGM